MKQKTAHTIWFKDVAKIILGICLMLFLTFVIGCSHKIKGVSAADPRRSYTPIYKPEAPQDKYRAKKVKPTIW